MTVSVTIKTSDHKHYYSHIFSDKILDLEHLFCAKYSIEYKKSVKETILGGLQGRMSRLWLLLFIYLSADMSPTQPQLHALTINSNMQVTLCGQ